MPGARDGVVLPPLQYGDVIILQAQAKNQHLPLDFLIQPSFLQDLSIYLGAPMRLFVYSSLYTVNVFLSRSQDSSAEKVQ